ncbi:GntR family transcriptional regulator [soil metagenome]
MNDRAPSLRFGPISAAAPGALYEQIIAAVKREVAAGRLNPGDPLPSVRALAADLLVSLITIKRAYDDLEREGVIYSRQGLGTFVADAGAAQVRRQHDEATVLALRAAIEAGRNAGLADDDLIDRLKTELAKGRHL